MESIGNDVIDFVILLNKSLSNNGYSSCIHLIKNLNGTCSLLELHITLRIYCLLEKIYVITDKHDPKLNVNCRFGNIAFSYWLNEVIMIYDELIEEYHVVDNCDSEIVLSNIKEYFLHSFGNGKRLDYGTGHELKFIQFLNELYSIGTIKDDDLEILTLIVINRYFELVRHLIDRYTLEPAGSKGCWGIDDYQFLPFIFGSSQLISNNEICPLDAIKVETIKKYRDEYMFIRAIEYKITVSNNIPLKISSPMIYNILSSCTWDKINSGLIKLYIDDVNRLNTKNVFC